MRTKKCPYCGQSLDNAALKCTRCNKWVDNELFDRLCEDDVKLIKNNDLTPFTPTLIAAMVINLLKEDDFLREDIQKREGRTLNERQQFNLLVFSSFCYFESISSFVRMKKGCRPTITEMLKVALLQGVVELFNATVGHAFPVDVLKEQGKALYAKFQAILDELGTSASSQLKASNAFGAIVFGEDSPLSIRGLSLYTYFMEAFTPDMFTGIFLVEEDDFDWQAIVGT